MMKKKLVAIASLLAVVLGPNAALAQQTVNTSLTPTTSGGAAPLVEAKWEMNGYLRDTTTGPIVATGKDDVTTAEGAQFDPSGVYQQDKKITICGIVSDADGLGDIAGVYGDVYYPQIALGANHEAGRQGCGQMVGTECTMQKLTRDEGVDLFCNRVRNGQSTLPTFNTGKSWDSFCLADGELIKQQAVVYCCDKEISYEDPSGDYSVDVWSQDITNKTGAKLNNHFTYNAMTAFAKDFTAVQYGSVRLNSWKPIDGDLTFGTNDRPTVRNLGNTRLAIKVAQDDMKLGDREVTPGNIQWNVQYSAKINNDGVWAYYSPVVKNPGTLPVNAPFTVLDKTLNLSQDDEIDFGIQVFKFDGTSFGGKMWLEAEQAAHLTCGTGTPI